MHNVAAELRKVCNHPHLVPDFRPQDSPSLVERVAASGKLQLLDQLLPRLRAAGQRVLLLSQSNTVCTLCERRKIGLPLLRCYSEDLPALSAQHDA